MACFAVINVSQGSVATFARCGGMFNVHLTANFLTNLLVKKIVNRLRFDRSMVMGLWSRWPILQAYGHLLFVTLGLSAL